MHFPLRFFGHGLAAGLLLSLLAACKPSAAPADASASPAPSRHPTLPVLGDAPAWRLTDIHGQPIGSDALRGKVVVVDFWATWCAPCVQEIPGYVALQKKYADRGLVIVGLSVDQQGEAVVRSFVQRMKVDYPVAMATSDVVEAFGDIEVIPTTFLVDREGKVRHRKIGAMSTADYEKLIAAVL
jgi:Peroxiredoxin